MRNLMKFLIIFLVLTINMFGAPHYLALTSAGDSTGHGSWANQKNYSLFTWSSLAGGDTVYFDGGVDSTTYGLVPMGGVPGNKVYIGGLHPSSQVIFTHGKDVGHNGKVIFVQSGTPAGPPSSLYLQSCSNLKFTGFTIKTLVDTAVTATGLVTFKQGYLNVLDNCTLISYGNCGGFTIYGEDRDTITNNHIEVAANQNVHNFGEDVLWIGNGSGGHVVTGNTFIGHTLTTNHPDMIQIYNEGSIHNYRFTIANNFLLSSDSTNQCIYATALDSNRFLIYNNVISMEGLHGGQLIKIDTTKDGVYPRPYFIPLNSVRIYNNTLVSRSSAAPITMIGVDSLIFKNNVVYSLGNSTDYMFILGYNTTGFGNLYKDIDYNHYYRLGGLVVNHMAASQTGGNYTWATWKQLNSNTLDLNSDTGTVNFVNLWGTNASDYKLVSTSKGVDQGTTITTSSPAYDGTTRPQGIASDMGAFETHKVTNYYLSTANSLDSTGLSWTHAHSVYTFNWSILADKDTAFVDGGADSIIYAPLSILNVRPFSGRAVITKGNTTGHNGTVIFSLTATTEDGYALQLVHCINTTVTGLTIRIKASGCTNSTPFKPNWALYMTYWYASPIDEMNGIIIDNCHITSNGWGSLINLEAQTGTSITNCLLDIPYNNTQSEQDCIDIKYGSGGGYTITDNTIHIVGSLQAPDEHHPEVIQWWGGHDALKNNYETKIANNFITFFCQSAGFGPGIFLFSEVPGNRFLIYNNIIVMKNAVGSDAQKMITICPVLTGEGTDGQDTSYNISLRLYNNTIVNGDSHGYGLWLEYIDTLIVKNNIFMNTGDSAATVFNYSRGSLSGTKYKDIDYNQYYQHPFSGSPNMLMYIDSVNSVSWTGWQALYNTNGTHTDAHSNTGMVSFASLGGTNASNYKLSPGSPGINQGTTITLTSPDIAGTVRTSGTYDDGAFEYTSVYHNLTLDANPSIGGTVSPPGTTSHLENSNVSITATPNSGYHFVSWTTDTPPNLVSTDNPYVVGMDVDYYFTAQFAVNVTSPPTLVSPTSGITGMDSTLSLLWQVVTGAVSYRLQVSVSSGFSSGIIFDEAGLSGSMAKTVSGLSYGTEYYWRVNATNSNGTSDWSSIWNFTTSSTPMQLPTVPVLIFPANGQTNQPLTATFVWGSIGASSYTITIQHQITNGRSTANVIDIIATVSTNSFTYNLPSIGTQYFWSVTATNTAGTSLPSVTKSFGSLVCH